MPGINITSCKTSCQRISIILKGISKYFSFPNTSLMMNQWILSFLVSQWASSWNIPYHVSTYLEISKKWISNQRKEPKKAANCSQLEKSKKLNWSKSTVQLLERDSTIPLVFEQLSEAGWKTYSEGNTSI